MEAAGGSDRYVFVAPASGCVSLASPTCPNGFTWQLVPEDTNHPTGTDPCQSYPLEVTPGDTYTLIASNDSAASSYQFTLRDGPVPQLFEIATGTTVSDGVPEPGAGNIEERGSVDLYDITDGDAYVQLTSCTADLYRYWEEETQES